MLRFDNTNKSNFYYRQQIKKNATLMYSTENQLLTFGRTYLFKVLEFFFNIFFDNDLLILLFLILLELLCHISF